MTQRFFVLALTLLPLWSPSSAARLRAATGTSVLPTPSNARTLLTATTRHREWVNIEIGKSSMSAFIVYPERADKAPAVLVTAQNEAAGVRTRALADQLAGEGFITIVPDLVGGLGTSDIGRRYNAARIYAEQLPAANGTSAWLNIDERRLRAEVSGDVRAGVARFRVTPADWPRVVAYLSRVTGNQLALAEGPAASTKDGHAMDIEDRDHRAHLAAMAAQQQTGRTSAPRMIPNLADKPANLPASSYTATATLARSTLKKEWVDIPLGNIKLHTWVEYPQGNAKTGVVIVMQHGVGLDDWMRSVADQLAVDGFIAVAPDAWSGTGPNGGNRDSFKFDDDAMKAGLQQISLDEMQRRYKVARDWALALPRANGKTGSIGFCMGGTNSFRFAAEVPGLNAAVVFYGGGPTDEPMKKINAPVLGFYGENDARVTATVAPTTEAMKRLGKSYEPHVYPKVTHSFVYFQDMALNRDATADAWPRTVAFFNKYLK